MARLTVTAIAAALLAAVLASTAVSAFEGMYWSNSLKAPFNEINEATGTKKISGWSHGGSVQIKQNFVRLTPDKPSRTGWLFNTAAGPEEDFTVLIRFRISGAAEGLSGDGMAFWYTATQNFNHGLLMGSTDSFVGIGVLFDTFANDELHRDVVVVASNGRDVVELSNAKKYPGCELKFRRWEGRDDFSVDQESVAKISILGTRIIVEIDPLGNGEFQVCADKDMVKLLPAKDSRDANWKSRAHIAISATTGALHDNHDILEVLTTSAAKFDSLMELQDEAEETPAVMVKMEDGNVTVEDVGHSVNSLSYEVKDIDERLNKLHHEIEHQIEKVAHRLEELIESLSKQEKKLENRVGDLEKRLSSSLFQEMETRLSNLEQQIYKTLDNRQQFVTKHIGASFSAAQTEASKWKTPFMIFAVLVFAVLGYLVFTVFRINKKVAKEQRFFD